jgi:hypothetical protein
MLPCNQFFSSEQKVTVVSTQAHCLSNKFTSVYKISRLSWHRGSAGRWRAWGRRPLAGPPPQPGGARRAPRVGAGPRQAGLGLQVGTLELHGGSVQVGVGHQHQHQLLQHCTKPPAQLHRLVPLVGLQLRLPLPAAPTRGVTAAQISGFLPNSGELP